jgi:hypothetical protein
MPHYVAKPTQKSLKYYVFSTVVMAPITKKMYRAEMEQWLKDNGYECYLDSTPWTEAEPEWYPEGSRLKEYTDKYTYWNGSFWFVTEEDCYFV